MQSEGAMSRRKSNRIKRKLNGSNISPMNVSYLWDYASLNQRRKIAKQIKRKTEKRIGIPSHKVKVL